jgi:hypothetical protein
MQQPTSRQLYAYWDGLRNGRIAPRRSEIEPAMISQLLPETFIAERAKTGAFRFRLAGTRICQQFGRELRDTDLLGLWDDADREAVAALLHPVMTHAAVACGRFRAYAYDKREVNFELLFLPLIHQAERIDRLLGAVTAIAPPYWLGVEPLLRQELIELNLHWPDGAASLLKQTGARVIDLASRRFRNVERRDLRTANIARARFPKF